MTKNMEFYTVINRGYGSLDLLDALINVNYDARLQFRVGRMKTPFAYEYWQIAEGDLIAPERSMFVGNLSGNREDGGMFHGQIFEKSAEWAVGLFNGPRRSFGDNNNAKDLYSYFNYRPFMHADWGGPAGVLQHRRRLQLRRPAGVAPAGRVHHGQRRDDRDQRPVALADVADLQSNVIDNGMRASWSGHIAWYVKSWALLAEYEGGFETFSPGATGARVKVPQEGYMVQSWYFLTGETLNRRVNVVKPKKDFGVKAGKVTGPGAVEIHGRFNEMNVGNQVFTGGLVDQNAWSNSAYTTDFGLNWYPNEYTKVDLDWQHAVFGRPVFVRPGGTARTENLLWLRFQLYF